MSRARAAAVFVSASILLSAGIVAVLLAVFPGFFKGLHAEGLVIGSVVGWAAMLLTFFLALYTVDKSPNAFLGGYAAGFLLRLGVLGITFLAAWQGERLPLEVVLVSLTSSYFVLFLLEAGVLSRLDGFAPVLSKGAASER